jgi:hypothetical protein
MILKVTFRLSRTCRSSVSETHGSKTWKALMVIGNTSNRMSRSVLDHLQWTCGSVKTDLVVT